jgi:mannosyltransferase OCH1-like enzyme
MAIPKIVHYVWVGPKSIPEEDQRRVDYWRTVLPDWEFRFWNNDTVNYESRYLAQAYSVRAWNRVSDYTRMDALSRFGGVYLDTDIDLHRSLNPLLDNAAFLGFQTGDELPQSMVNGAVFGAEPGHWLPATIRDIFNNTLDGRVNIGDYAGPGLITKVLRDNGLTRYSDEITKVRDVTVYPKRYFYPYSWLETYSPEVVTPDTIAVHRWSETWVVRTPALKTRLRRLWIRQLARFAPEATLRSARLEAKQGSQQTVGSK